MGEATSGMVGGGYYDDHSAFQSDVAASGLGLLERAVRDVGLVPGSETWIADYGCSEGRNSMATVGSALALLAGRGAGAFSVLHSDLPTNDWNGLAANLSGPQSYLVRFPATRVFFAPRSFFERVAPPSSMALGTSGSAAHWLSRQPPGLDMPRSLYRSDAPAPERARILEQAAGDWLAFLAARAEELRPGGVLFVQMLGTDAGADPPRVSGAGLLRLMNECALRLVDDGDVPADVYARYAFPVVPRTVAEAGAPFAGALRDRLDLLYCGLRTVASPFEQDLARSGDAGKFARDETAFVRAFSESSLRDGVFRFGKGSAEGLAARFYAMMQEALAAHPERYPFDDLTLTLIARRR